jgi:transposase
MPRRDIVHAPAGVCKACGGIELRRVGESVTEVLEYIPGRFEVARHVRPAVSCRKCEAMMQAPMPEPPIPRGMARACSLISPPPSFCYHLPPYQQAEIYARSGVDFDRGQLVELGVLSGSHVMSGRVIHADDAPVPVLAPGSGRAPTGRQRVGAVRYREAHRRCLFRAAAQCSPTPGETAARRAGPDSMAADAGRMPPP